MTGNAGVLRHDCRRLLRDYEEKVKWQGRFRRDWLKLTFGTREIESAERFMDKRRPTTGADQPRNRNAAAVGAELIAALSAAHPVSRAAPVELRPAFAQAEQRY